LFKKSKRQSSRIDKMGVVYLSIVPPFMNPSSLRKLMEARFKGVERIYMEPEREHVRKNRVKSGGNRKTKYTEAWVEFANKKTAKNCALMLNNTQVGGKKRHNLYYDDLWNVRYLSKFKW